MTLILEYRDKIKKFYRMNAVVILPIVKFLLAFIALNGVNTMMMGSMPRLDTLAVVLVASLACSFLPAGCLTLLCAMFSLGHMFAMSLEMMLIGFAVYVLIFLLLLRFAPSDSYVVVLTPLFFALKMPYVIPIAVGLISSPLSAISVGCGVIVYYLLKMMVGAAPEMSQFDENDITEKLRYLIDALMKNKAILVVAGAFAITVLVVWLIRRMAIEHAWTIAMVAGAMVNLVLLLLGNIKYDVQLSLGSAIFGTILALLVAKVIEFFRFCVDYGNTEWVQFEDDDYYYYVKAVPKMTAPAQTKPAKKPAPAKSGEVRRRPAQEGARSASGAVKSSAPSKVAGTKTGTARPAGTRPAGTKTATRPASSKTGTRPSQGTVKTTRPAPQHAIDEQAYETKAYDAQAVNNALYDTQSYDTQSYDTVSYDTQAINNAAYDTQSYDAQGYDNQGYDNQGYDNQGYDNQNYDNQTNDDGSEELF